MTGLIPGFEVICADFEFVRPAGERSTPVCMVAKELSTGRVHRLWADDLARLTSPPFSVGRDAIFVAYAAAAEMGCFRALGWPMPMYLIDLYVEFGRLTSGVKLDAGRGLLGALAYFGLQSISASEKDTWRERIMAGPPYSPAEREGILQYCQTDVDALERLLPCILPHL